MEMTSTATIRQPIPWVFQSKAETTAFYNKIVKVYDLLAEESEGPVREAGIRKLEAHAGESLLELGFGTGHSLLARLLPFLSGSHGELRISKDRLLPMIADRLRPAIRKGVR